MARGIKKLTNAHKMKLLYGKYEQIVRENPNRFNKKFRTLTEREFEERYNARANTLKAEGSNEPVLKSLLEKNSVLSEKQAKGLKNIKKNKQLLNEIEIEDSELANKIKEAKSWRDIRRIQDWEIDDLVSKYNQKLKSQKIGSLERARIIGVEFYGSPK